MSLLVFAFGQQITNHRTFSTFYDFVGLQPCLGSDRIVFWMIWMETDDGRWCEREPISKAEKANVPYRTPYSYVLVLFVWVFRSQSQMPSSAVTANADAMDREEEALDGWTGFHRHVLSSL